MMYDCTKCGKKESSHDGYTFCSKCEQEYRQALAVDEGCEKKYLEKLACRVFVAGTKGSIGEYIPTKDGELGQFQMKIRRLSGVIEIITYKDCEPCEMPGGGFYLTLAQDVI